MRRWFWMTIYRRKKERANFNRLVKRLEKYYSPDMARKFFHALLWLND